MMKKSILSLIAGAIVALASCSQTDEMPGQPQEGEQLATFTIQTPAATRADVAGDLSRFIVEAYEGSSVTGTPAARVEAATGTLTLGLKKNTVYTFVFWADKGTAKDENIGTASNGYWDAADLKAVKVTFGRGSVKGEVAYCLAKTFNSKDFEANKTVTLRNATAQVNFVEAAGLSAADNTLTVTYSAGATLNVGTGKVTEVSEAITHIFINIGQVSAGATLATDYILAPKGEQMVRDLTLKLNTEDPKSVTNVPFEQCFKTNIKGEYSSLGQFTFTVEADDEWETPDHEYDFAVWDGTYPADVATAKAWLGEAVSSGTDGKDYVFEISTAKQLCALQTLINQNISDAVTTNNTYTYATYKLTADINLNNHQWAPLGIFTMGGMAFYGVFDGQGHTISGLNVSESQKNYVGFIGYVQNGGIVKYLTVKGEVEYTGTGGASIGGIAGENYGTIAFCSFEGTAKTTSVNTVESRLGWICGKNLFGGSDDNTGQIISCFAKGTISGNTGVQTGGMTSINTDLSGNSGIISGCTWYYKSGATPEGIEKCYSGWTSGGDNASYSTESELSGRVSTMNQNATNYNYKWEASGSTLKLVKKQ
jgi:hypothetical protein